jgi:hypothetical protein
MQIAIQFAFSGETFLERLRRVSVSLPKEDFLIGFREHLPQVRDPFALTSRVPLPFMLEWARLELTLCRSVLVVKFPWSRSTRLAITKSERAFFVFLSVYLNRAAPDIVQLTIENLGRVWCCDDVSSDSQMTKSI